jgi:hypothetical protein
MRLLWVRTSGNISKAFFRAQSRGKAFVFVGGGQINSLRKGSMNRFIVRLILAIIILGIGLMLIPHG